MSVRLPLLLIGVVAAALTTVIVIGLLRREVPDPAVAMKLEDLETDTTSVVVPDPSAVVPPPAPELPAEALVKHNKPGRYPMKVPFSSAGVRTPDGRYLPLLNGVPLAAPLKRQTKHFGQVPPIVAKHVDHSGLEWWEHEDGSVTTTRWTEVKVFDPGLGTTSKTRLVETVHGTKVPDTFALPGGDPGTPPPVAPGPKR